MTHRRLVGTWGEETAAQYLLNRGLQILAKNIHTPYGEIDIVAKLADMVIFVEVKTLTSSKNFFPEQNVTVRKREHMLHSAEYYAAQHGIDHWQIDVIAVEGTPNATPVITHFEQAV